MELAVQDVSGSDDAPDDSFFETWVRAALAEDDVTLTVRVVDEDEMTELNQRYRHKAGATNVLSFPFENPPGVESNILGDVVVCAPVVMREAQDQGITPMSHWAHMVVHGVLHLRGFDHGNEEEAKEMEALESRILGELGFPAPYIVA